MSAAGEPNKRSLLLDTPESSEGGSIDNNEFADNEGRAGGSKR